MGNGFPTCQFVQTSAPPLSRNPLTLRYSVNLAIQSRDFPSSTEVARLEQRRYQSNTTDKEAEDTTDSSDNKSELAVTGEGTKDLGIPGAQKGGKKLAIIYTCAVCDTRSARQFTENAYNNGVVIVQCPGCDNRHLIADNLGFFSAEEDGWNIEKGMKKMGGNVQAVNNDNVLELSIEDVFGEQAIENATKKS